MHHTKKGPSKADLAAEEAEEEGGASCTDAGHDMPVIQERRHEFVWLVWTRLGKKQDDAEEDATYTEDATFAGGIFSRGP